jgi:hypothetical protein
MRIREAIKNGLISGGICFVLSFAANYFVIPFPKDAVANGIGNGISGLISGFISAFVTVMIITSAKNKKNFENMSQ